MNKILTSLTLILTIADLAFRYWKLIKFDILTTPIISLNTLEIVIVVLCAILGYRLLPKNLNRLYFQSKAKNFHKNWKKFKNILVEYQQQKNPNLQKDYKKIREKLLDDFNFFLPTIKSIKHRPYKDTEDIALTNLENCIFVSNIENWFQEIKRKVPEELDCFDCFIANLEGYYRNPEYYK